MAGLRRHRPTSRKPRASADSQSANRQLDLMHGVLSVLLSKLLSMLPSVLLRDSPTIVHASSMVCCALNTSGLSDAGSLRTCTQLCVGCVTDFKQARVCVERPASCNRCGEEYGKAVTAPGHTNLRMVPPPASASATAAGAKSREAARARCPACCSTLVSWSLLLLPCCCFSTPADQERGPHVSFHPRGTQGRRLHAYYPQHTMCGAGCVLGAAPAPGHSIGDADVVCPACRQHVPAPALLV